MCGRAYSPQMLWMWPNAGISAMCAEQAAGVFATAKQDQAAAVGEVGMSKKELAAFKAPTFDKHGR